MPVVKGAESQMRYEVQTNTVCDGWVNTWTEEVDGVEQPMIFATVQEAKDELDDFIADAEEAFANGDLGDPYTINDYRIVPIQ